MYGLFEVIKDMTLNGVKNLVKEGLVQISLGEIMVTREHKTGEPQILY